MKILIACEYSGTVRDAFIAQGHEAISCDILPTDSPGPHYQGDVRDIMDDGFDLMIAHPPCTYLSNSGVCWLHKTPGRWALLDEACEFFNIFLDSSIPLVCVENPVPHKYAIERLKGRKYTHTIQPYQFGHRESKRTCLWLKGLKPLAPTTDLKEETMALPANQRSRMHYLPPSKNRDKLRSKTYQGIADAMSKQWGAK